MEHQTNVAVFGGGCFWCTEAVFKMLTGVISVKPGYAGGITNDPTYETVSEGNTGHVEVVQVTFDPALVTFRDLLMVFFSSHDPTSVGRQGDDVGTQYRSAIFTTSEYQLDEARAFLKEISSTNLLGHSDTTPAPVVTTVEPLKKFYEAEDYHLNYYLLHQTEAYCEAVINPKLEKVKRKFGTLFVTPQSHDDQKSTVTAEE